MATIRGGEKKNWKDNSKSKTPKYNQHLREVARQGKGFSSDGNIQDGKAVDGAMHKFLIDGYRIGQGR